MFLSSTGVEPIRLKQVILSNSCLPISSRRYGEDVLGCIKGYITYGNMDQFHHEDMEIFIIIIIIRDGQGLNLHQEIDNQLF